MDWYTLEELAALVQDRIKPLLVARLHAAGWAAEHGQVAQCKRATGSVRYERPRRLRHFRRRAGSGGGGGCRQLGGVLGEESGQVRPAAC